MDLSIIIPCHNLEHYIAPLLSSLYNQEINDIEVEYIFVLDNCKDNTKKVIKKWTPSITNATIHIYEVNYKSCGLARNYGFEHSSGEYIWFVDGDDMLLGPNAIQTLYNTIKSINQPLIRFKFLSIWGLNNPNPEKVDWIMIWQYIFKRDFIEDIKFPSTQPHEDREFMLKVFKKLGEIDKIGFIQKPYYLYNFGRKGSNMMDYLEKRSNKDESISSL